MDDVSLTVGLISIDRLTHPQKIPTTLPAVVPEICAIVTSLQRPPIKYQNITQEKEQMHCDLSFPIQNPRERDLEQRCFNGRNVKKFLDKVRIREE